MNLQLLLGIGVLLLISLLWAIWSLRELKKPKLDHVEESLKKNRVLFYASSSSSTGGSAPSSDKSSSSVEETSGLSS